MQCLAVTTAAALVGVVTGCGSSPTVLSAHGDLIAPASFVGREAQLDGLLGQPQLDPAGVLDARAALADRLDLARLLSLASARNPELRRLRADILAAEGHLQQAAAAPNPQLDVGVSRIPLESDQSLGQTDVTAGLRQKLPVTGRSGIARREAQAQLSAREALALARARELQFAVCAAFVRYQTTWEVEKLRARIVTERQTQVDIVQRETDQGRRPTVDILDARDRLARARLAHLTAMDALTDARAELREAVGDHDFSPGPPPEDWTLPDAPLYLDRVSEQGWVVGHPLVVAAASNISRAEAAIDAAGVSHLEDPELRLGYLYTGADNGHWLTARLILPLPVFDQATGAVRESRAQEVAARARRDEAVISLLARLDRALRRHSAAESRLREYDQQLVPAARQRLELAERQAVSRVSTAELAEVRAGLLDVECGMWDARRDLAVAIHELNALLAD